MRANYSERADNISPAVYIEQCLKLAFSSCILIGTNTKERKCKQHKPGYHLFIFQWGNVDFSALLQVQNVQHEQENTLKKVLAEEKNCGNCID